MAIIDSHLHLWDPDRLTYDWLADVPAIAGAHLPAGWRTAADGVDVAGIVFVQADCVQDQALDEARWVASLAGDDFPLLGVVAFAPVEAADVGDALDRLGDVDRVVGIRRLLQGEPSGFIHDPGVIAGVQTVGARGLAFDVCVTADQLPAVIELVDACPDTTFVLDHLGKPAIADDGFEPWASDLRDLARREQVGAVKLSGLLTEAGDDPSAERVRPYLDHALETFGPDRCMLGSDWPVVDLAGSYADWFRIVGRALDGLSSAERRAVESATARRVYRLGD